jgi:hypothetical protein
VKRRIALVVALAAAIAGAVPAAAQIEGSIFLISFDLGNPRTVKQWDLPVRWEGSVVVRFQSAFGSGETVWTPGPTGQFTVAENRTRSGRRMFAFLASTTTALTHARVESPWGVCTDTSSSELFDRAAVVGGANGVRLGLASASPRGAGFHMSETDCGGPLFDDIGRALGMVALPRAKLLKGGFDIDFRGSAPLVTTAGMRGTVASTVVAHVGARQPPPRQSRERATPGGSNLMTVRYRIERVSGRMQADFTGGGELCAELASCGARELIGMRTAAPRGAALEISAYASGKRPLADLRAALGLPNKGGRSKGIAWSGHGSLSSRTTLVSASLIRDGTPVCKDQRHVPALELGLRPDGGRIEAHLAAGVTTSMRTSCPGPALSRGGFEPILAAGSLPRDALEHKRITLRLTQGQRLESDGWSGRTRADFTIVLRRTSVSTRHFDF